MPAGLVGQGAEFSRSSCVLVKLTVRQPKRVSISLALSLQNLSAPPFPFIGMLGLVPGLTQTHTETEISALPSSSLPWTYPSGSTAKLPSLRMTLDHFSPPAHSSQSGGQGRGATAVSGLWLCHYRAADIYTVHNAHSPTNWIAFVPQISFENAFSKHPKLEP